MVDLKSSYSTGAHWGVTKTSHDEQGDSRIVHFRLRSPRMVHSNGNTDIMRVAIKVLQAKAKSEENSPPILAQGTNDEE